jgi:hypothetical protein
VLARGPLAPFLLGAGFVRYGPGFRLAEVGPLDRTDEPTGADAVRGDEERGNEEPTT